MKIPRRLFNPTEILRVGATPFRLHAAVRKLQDYVQSTEGMELTYAQAKMILEKMAVAESHKQMRVVEGGKRRANPVSKTWYHNTSKEIWEQIKRNGMDAGSFSSRPIDFGGDVWITVKEKFIPRRSGFNDVHQYGNALALEPYWEITGGGSKGGLLRNVIPIEHIKLFKVKSTRANPVTHTPGADWVRGRIAVAQSILNGGRPTLIDHYVWDGGYLRFCVLASENKAHGTWWYGIYYDTKKGKKAVGMMSLRETADCLVGDDAVLTKPYRHKGLYRAALGHIRALAGKPIRSSTSRSAAAEKSWKKSGATFLKDKDQWQMNPPKTRHVFGGMSSDGMPSPILQEPRRINGLRLGRNKFFLGTVIGHRIYEVDGMHVRKQWDDFYGGGNSKAYTFVPKGEFWIDSGLKYHWDKVCYLWHEIFEYTLMEKKGWKYTKAHLAANKAEQELRTHDPRQMTQEKFMLVVLGNLLEQFGNEVVEQIIPYADDIARKLNKI